MKSKAIIIKELQSEISQNNDRYFESIYHYLKASDDNDSNQMQFIIRELEEMDHEWKLYTNLLYVAQAL